MRSLIADLRAITGAAHVLTEPESMAGYLADWTGRYGGAASCVVRPGSVAEVAAVIRSCADRGAAIIPQGGNTGLVGGSVPPARPPAEPSAGGPHGGGRTGGTGACRTGAAMVGGAPPGVAPTGSGPIAGPPPAPPTSDPTARALVVLSARRLTDLRPVDVLAGQVTAGAGVTIGRLRAHAAAGL